MKLLSRASRQLPGITGIARVSRDTPDAIDRANPGDVVVIDQPDIDRRTADELVAARVRMVVNAAHSITGRYPNLGPEVLVHAGVVLVDGLGDKVFSRIKDGTRVRLEEGTLYAGEEIVGTGTVQTAESIADQMIDAKTGMAAQLEAFAANAI